MGRCARDAPGTAAGRVPRPFAGRRRTVARACLRRVPAVRRVRRFRPGAAPVSLRPLRRRPSPVRRRALPLFAYAGDVRAAIVSTKYAGRPYPVDAVALRIHETLAGRWRDLIPDGAPPTVVPVPADPWKYFRRGFNLPALIASRISRRGGFPLTRWRFREPGSGFPRRAFPETEGKKMSRGLSACREAARFRRQYFCSTMCTPPAPLRKARALRLEMRRRGLL